jgi:hypothetical protein
MKKPFLRKGQKFRITNLHNVDWYEMGLTMEEYNEGQKEDGMTMVINGDLYCYDERYCSNKDEVVKQSLISYKDISENEIYGDVCGVYSLMEGLLYRHYGLFVEDGVEIKPITEEEVKKDCENPINTNKIKYKTIVEVK